MMHNSTLCYVTRGDDVLMLHRVKKKNDINKLSGSASAESLRKTKAPMSACSGKPWRRLA